jgi:hypothetical protein
MTTRSRREQPAHSVRRSAPPLRRLQLVGAVAGLAAAALTVGLGTAALIRTPPRKLTAGPTAEHMTVPVAAAGLPLSDAQIVGLLGRRPDYGPLNDPQRRASCLTGLGYPGSTDILGARPVQMNGHPGVLMLLPGDTAGALIALVVKPNCSSVNTGLLARNVLARP